MKAPHVTAEIFNGVHSRVVLYDPGRTQLIVTFDHYNKDKTGFVRSQPSRLFRANGFANLRIQTAHNDWFVNPDLPAIEALLPAVVAPYSRVVSLGYSLGGYGALRLSLALRASHVLAVSPQVSLDPMIAPFERRFRREAMNFDPVLGDLVPCANPNLSGVVLFDPFNTADRAHAEAIKLLFPGLELAPLAFSGHPASRVLAQVGEGDFLRQCAMDPGITARDIVSVHRAARRLSPLYWTSLARALRRRSPEAAARAADEAAVTERWLLHDRANRRRDELDPADPPGGHSVSP